MSRHYQAAVEARNAGQLARAEQEYLKALAELYYRWGKLAQAAQDDEKAIVLFQKAAKLCPDREVFRLDLAASRFGAGDYRGSLGDVRQLLALNPANPQALNLAGKLYFVLEDYEKARQHLQKALELAPASSSTLYTLAITELRQRNREAALPLFDRLLELNGESAQLRLLMGLAYRGSQFFDETLQQFQRAESIDASLPSLHAQIGLTYLLRDPINGNQDAERQFRKELQRNPNEETACFFMGAIAAIRQQWEDAVSWYQKAASLNPDSPDALLGLGRAYAKLGQHEKAAKALDASIRKTRDPLYNQGQLARAYYSLGNSLRQLNRREEATRAFQRAAELNQAAYDRENVRLAAGVAAEGSQALPDPAGSASFIRTDHFQVVRTGEPQGLAGPPEPKLKAQLADLWNDVGVVRSQLEKLDEGENAFTAALELDGAHPDASLNLGLLYYKQRRCSFAIPLLERAKDNTPTSTRARHLLALCYFSADQYEKAVPALEEWAASDPNSPVVLFPLAFSYAQLGRASQSSAVLYRLIRQNPEMPEVHLLMGQAHYIRGVFGEAIQELKRASQLDPDLPMAHYYLGLIYLRLGKLEESAEEFMAELKLDPRSAKVYQHLGYVRTAQGNPPKAIPLLETATKLDPQYPAAFYDLARAHIHMGDHEKALPLLQRAIELDPSQPHFHFLLARAYQRLGNQEAASAELQVARKLKSRQRSEKGP